MNEKEKFFSGWIIFGILTGIGIDISRNVVHPHILIWEAIGCITSFLSGICFMGYVVKCNNIDKKDKRIQKM